MQQYQQIYTPGWLDHQPYSLHQQQAAYVTSYLPQQPGHHGLQPTQQPSTQHDPAAAAVPSQPVLLTPHPAAATAAAVHPVQEHPGRHRLLQHYTQIQHPPQQQQHLGPRITQQFAAWSSQPSPMHHAQSQPLPHPGQHPVQQLQQSVVYLDHQLWHQQQPAPSQYQQQVNQGCMPLRASLTSFGQYLAPQQLQSVPQPYGHGQQQPAALQYQQLPRGDRKPPTQQQKPISERGLQTSLQQKQQQIVQVTLPQLRQRQQLKFDMMLRRFKKQEEHQRRQQAGWWRGERERRAAIIATAETRKEEQRQQCMEQNMKCSRLLQLPEGIFACIAARLTNQERLMFARLVLSQNSAAATEVLGTIHSLRFCREDLRSKKLQDKNHWINQHAPFHCMSGSAHVHYSKCPRPLRDIPSFVAALKNLRSLSLELDPSGRMTTGNPAFEPYLPEFARLTDLSRLTSLQLTVLAREESELQVQEAALRIIAQLSSLRVLAFEAQGGTRSFDKMAADRRSAGVFAALSGLNGLQCLQLQYYRSSEDLGLGTLSGLTNLTELQLQEQHSMSLGSTQKFTSNVRQLAPLLTAAKLQIVTLQGVTCYMYPLAVRPDDLRVLDITGCTGLGLFPELTPPLPRCTTLQELRAGSCRELYLANSGLGHAEVAGNASSVAAALASSLTLLDINDAGLIPWGLEFVSQLTSLRSLNIAGTWLGKHAGVVAAAAGVIDQGNYSILDNMGTLEILAKHLTGLTSLAMGCLASVNVGNYIIPAGELLWLTRLVHLNSLAVHGSVFEGSGWQAKTSKLATCLAECTALKQLTLRGCGFDVGDSKRVSQVLQQAGVGAKGLNVVLCLQPSKVTSVEAVFDDGDTYFYDDLDDSDGGYGFDMEDRWGEGFDSDAYQDEFVGLYPADGAFDEV